MKEKEFVVWEKKYNEIVNALCEECGEFFILCKECYIEPFIPCDKCSQKEEWIKYRESRKPQSERLFVYLPELISGNSQDIIIRKGEV